MMQDPREFQEIESMGETYPQETPPQEVKSGGSGLLLFQAGICVLLLFGLVFLKASDKENYDRVNAWYQTEIGREIELPSWGERGAPASADTSLRMV